MSTPLRVAILGAGFMARVHGTRLLKMEGIEIAGVCGTALESAKALLQDLKVEARAYSSFEDMLRGSRCDAVYVCIPPFAHDGQVESAAREGKHVFVEKPLGLTNERAESMCAAVKEAGVLSQVGYHIRFRKAVMRMRALLASGDAGRATLFDGRFWCNMDGSTWWRDAARSGGQVSEQVTHLYDLALCFLGTPERASGFAANLCHSGQPGYTSEDTSVGAVRFRDGGLAAITGSNCAIKDRFIGDFRLVCEHATLDYHSTGDWREQDVARIDFANRIEEIIEDGDAHEEADRDFVRAIRSGGKTACPIADGARAVKLTLMVLQSAQAGGEPVAW